MPHNINSMAYYGEPPWHGLGTPIPERATAAEMIKAADLDWEVKKLPVEGARLGKDDKPLKYSLIRKARANHPKEKDVLLGLVTPAYQPLQNEEAFNFFDPIVGKEAATFETAGALGDGERVWVLAKLPGRIRVVGNDIVDKYLLLSNSHNGKESVTVKFTPIRVVCQNTLILALKDGEKTVRVRHTTHMVDRLAEVPKLLNIFNSVYESAELMFRALVNIQMDHDRLTAYLEALYPRTEQQRKKKLWPERWGQVADLFEAGEPDLPQTRGTLWAVYNAVTRHEDYRQAKEAGPDRRLHRTWFGAGADLKLAALRKAEEFAHQWSK